MAKKATKFDQAFAAYQKEAEMSRDEFIQYLQDEFGFKKGTATTYFYKCKDKAEEKITRMAEVDKIIEKKITKRNREATLERAGITIPDCVPDFLLNSTERRIRAEQNGVLLAP